MDLSRAPDAYLTGAIANGDADAARALVDRYRRPLAAVLQRALGSPADVDDVFQETWNRVVRSAHRYDPEQRFSNWLFTIAWNLVKDRWSRRVEHDPLTDVASSAASAEEQLLRASRRSSRQRNRRLALHPARSGHARASGRPPVPAALQAPARVAEEVRGCRARRWVTPASRFR